MCYLNKLLLVSMLGWLFQVRRNMQVCREHAYESFYITWKIMTFYFRFVRDLRIIPKRKKMYVYIYICTHIYEEVYRCAQMFCLSISTFTTQGGISA